MSCGSDVCNIISILDPKKVSPEVFDIALFNKLRGDAADIGRRVRSSIHSVHPPARHVDSAKSKEKKVSIDDKGKEKEEEKEDSKGDVVFHSVFLDEFKRAYNSPAQAVKWYSKLDNLRQNSSDVIKYVNLVVNFSYRANQQVTEPEIIVRIIRGLDDHYRLRVSATSFKSVEEITTALTNIQSVDPPKSSHLTQSADSHSIQPSSSLSRGGSRSPLYGHSSRSRGNRYNYHCRPIICHHCGIKGHIAPNCPDNFRSHRIHQADVVECDIDQNINIDYEYGCMVQFVFNKDSDKRLTIPVSINGHITQGLIASGVM